MKKTPNKAKYLMKRHEDIKQNVTHARKIDLKIIKVGMRYRHRYIGVVGR